MKEPQRIPLRVANLIEEGRWGGPQKRITLVAAALKDHAVETTVLLPRSESERFRQALENAGVGWKALHLHRLGRGWKIMSSYALSFFPEIYRLWRELRNGRYDLLHVSGGAWQFKGPIAGRLAGVPVVWHLNDTSMPMMFVVLFKYLGKLADGFFVAAKRVQRYYIDNTALEKIPVYSVPAPVQTDLHTQQTDSKDKPIHANIFPRIVTIANINPIKGLQILIESCALLKKRLESFSVSIVGAMHPNQTSYLAMLNDLITRHGLETNVIFEGERYNVRSVLQTADIYVCSSFAEASPMAVWEAMSMGCAIVSTDVGDVAEYIKDGENGFVVGVGDAQAMADAICRLADDAELRQNFGRIAREVACRELDLRVIAEKTAAGYAAVLAACSR